LKASFGSGFKYLKRLSKLDLSGITGKCNIGYLSKDFFKNTPVLKEIDISNCKISHVDKGPFKSLRHLEKLDISHNKELGFSSLPNITWGLNHTSIKRFYADDIHCLIGIGTNLTTSHIQNLRQTRLVEISLARNRVELIGKGVLPNLPTTLEKLSFALNRLTTGVYLFEFHTLRNLKEFNMTFQLSSPKYFVSIFEQCNEKRESSISGGLANFIVAKSKQALMNHRKRTYTVYIPPKLETIYANSSKLYGKVPSINIKSKSLKNIYVQNNMYFEWYLPAFGFEKLERIDLSNNLCSRISPYFMKSGRGLKYMNVAKNMLARSLKTDQRCQLFRHQHRIEEFDFSFNRLVHIPICTFQNMVRMKILRLNDNQLTNINIRIRHMVNLSFVDLSNNRLTTMADQTIEEFNHIFGKRKVLINLKNNEFQCTCTNLHFLDWMNEHRSHFHHIEKYICSDQNIGFDFREMEKSIHQLKLRCMNLEIWIIISCVLITLVICMIAVLIFKKNVWHIRYFIYKNKHICESENTCRRGKAKCREPLLGGDIKKFSTSEVTTNSKNFLSSNQQDILSYPYDAFISYVGANRNFVTEEMKPKLEESGFNIFIRDIDFEAGDSKIENIMRGLARSKKTICVVSVYYLKSKWRNYELNMAKMEGMKARGSLRYVYLILMPDLFKDSTSCNTNIRDLIDQKCFLECPPKDSSLHEIFWSDLRSVIKNPY
jgi:Leucine-rich repeat (LRR) protein